MQPESTSYRTIKSLVFDYVHRCKGQVCYEALTEEVIKHFPGSKWKKSHWVWYRYQITRGRFQDLFSGEERASLRQGWKATRKVGTGPVPQKTPNEPVSLSRGPEPKDPEVKRIGDAILKHARFVISLSSQDADFLFRVNRWVHSRLLGDENRVKRPVKQKLWDMGMRSCQACGEPFPSPKGVEIHRKNGLFDYSVGNCELLCRECHQELSGHI